MQQWIKHPSPRAVTSALPPHSFPSLQKTFSFASFLFLLKKKRRTPRGAAVDQAPIAPRRHKRLAPAFVFFLQKTFSFASFLFLPKKKRRLPQGAAVDQAPIAPRRHRRLAPHSFSLYRRLFLLLLFFFFRKRKEGAHTQRNDSRLPPGPGVAIAYPRRRRTRRRRRHRRGFVDRRRPAGDVRRQNCSKSRTPR